MKLLIAFTAVLFSAFSMAGSVSSGSFHTQSESSGYTSVSGVTTITEKGRGTVSVEVDDIVRVEDYKRNDSSVDTFSGGFNTESYSETYGYNDGMEGYSSTDSNFSSDGYINSTVVVRNSIKGDYEVFEDHYRHTHELESGKFARLEESTAVSYNSIDTWGHSSNESAYSVWE